jgi:hypothetical protein
VVGQSGVFQPEMVEPLPWNGWSLWAGISGVFGQNTQFIMRPEFLLNFLSSSPKSEEIDPVVRDLLPSHVGLQIGQHLDPSHMHKILEHVDVWKELPEARREIKITEAVNHLKYDRLKRYENNLDLKSNDEADIVLQALKT